MKIEQYIWGFLRICLGWIFLWAFFDKVFGLGFTTAPDKAWIVGGSPTQGFLSFATKGPFADMFQSLAGSSLVDWLFMLGLLAIGVSLVLGIMMRLAVVGGVLMLMLMYVAVIPPEHNPIIDDHIIYSLILLSMWFIPVGEWIGLGKRWKNSSFVRKYKLLV